MRSSVKLAAAATAAVLTVGGGISTPSTAVAQAAPIYRAAIQPGQDETQLIATWRTSATSAPEVLELTAADGTTTVFPAQEKDAGKILYKSQFATATGLKPDTEYTYRVGSDEGGWSAPETYRTGNFDSEWSFVTVADAQIGVNLGLNEQAEQWRRTIGNAIADVPDAEMIWSLGDQVEGWGAPTGQYERFFSAPELRRVPINALPGNHETYASALELAHYDEHFINPNAQANRDFFFERNNVLFIGLNTTASSAAEIAAHERFLRDTVAAHAADNDWVIVGMHHSFFSQGDHYLDRDVTALRESLAPVMSELGVDAVLSGHDHIYTRTHLMNGLTPVEPEAAPQRGDSLSPQEGEVLYITTTSAGGGKFYDFADANGKEYPNARYEHIDKSLEHDSTAFWRQDYTEDYMRVDVSSDELTFTTYNANDPSMVDKVTLQSSGQR